MKNGITPLSDGYSTLDKSLLVYTKYQGQIFEAALKTLLIMEGMEKILVETGIGELPETYKEFHTMHTRILVSLTQFWMCLDFTPNKMSLFLAMTPNPLHIMFAFPTAKNSL